VYYAWLDGRENINTGRIYSKVYAGFPTTAVAEQSLPTAFHLGQNYPNPFNPSTTISYQLPIASSVLLSIFNTLGQVVATLVDEKKETGYYSVRWSANVPSGIYFYSLQAGDFLETKKMVLLR
jgi:hypothetical protein